MFRHAGGEEYKDSRRNEWLLRGLKEANSIILSPSCIDRHRIEALAPSHMRVPKTMIMSQVPKRVVTL